MSKWPSLINENPPSKNPNLELIKQEIPVIQNVHSSFWENPKFLRWQLMRLNKNYQIGVDKLWWEFWTPKYKDYGKDLRKAIEEIYQKSPPILEEALETWLKEVTEITSTGLKIIKKYFRIFDNFKPYPHETFERWHERLSHTELDPIRFHSMLESQFRDRRNHLVVAPWKLDTFNPPPIPWTVRFPFPPFLNKIPPWPNERKKNKGRPQGSFKDPGENLLVYELSQGGMKNMEIARLLFGVKKSRIKKGYDVNYKHPILTRIANIKKAVEETVSQAYPF